MAQTISLATTHVKEWVLSVDPHPAGYCSNCSISQIKQAPPCVKL